MAITIDGAGTITGIASGGLNDNIITEAELVDNSVSLSKLTETAQPIGFGQTWQDVTASRALGVTFTNTTGRSIFFMVSITQNSGGIGTNGAISGLGFNAHQDNGSSSTGSFVGLVPNGATYGNISVESGKSILRWLELR